MNELLIRSLEEIDITACDFKQLKADMENVLSEYKTIVYTDETIKTAKDDKARLGKAKKRLEDERKAYKARCLEPYNVIEPQVKEIVGMIEEQRLAIDEVVKDFTDREKAEKEKIVRKYYDKKSFVLGDMAEVLYEKLLDQKWLNKTASKAKVEEEIQAAINKAADDIAAVREMNSPFVNTLLETYASTLSLDGAKAKHTELMEAAAKAGMNRQTDSAPAQEAVREQVTADSGDGVIFKVYGSQSQINQVMDFMKAIGVSYEIQ